MAEAARFVGDTPLAAHNASFDRKFWQAELASLGLDHNQPFVCTVLLSRRLYPRAPNHKLGTLVDHLALAREGRAHRALSDAQVTAALLGRMQSDLAESHGLVDVGHGVLAGLQRCARASVPAWLQRQASLLTR
jgi:DNA polymerase-3 subunit epsilon